MQGLTPSMWRSVASWIGRSNSLWQVEFLSAEEFARYASDHGCGQLSRADIIDLWRLRILRADFVETKVGTCPQGFELVEGPTTDQSWLIDLREPPQSLQLLDGLRLAPAVSPDVTPWFHPFRIATLVQLLRPLELRIKLFQYLRYAEGGATIEEMHRRSIEHVSDSAEVSRQLAKVEMAVELAILCEPRVSPSISDWIRGWPDPAEHKAALEAYWSDVSGILRELPEEDVERGRWELCVLAERLDYNSTMHKIARFMSSNQRRALKGDFGGAMFLNGAAETLRRGCEVAWSKELPEEDELAHGPYLQRVKKSLYGSARLLDRDSKVREEFLRLQGLDYGTRVRWYTEGDTEIGALRAALGQFRPVELANLRGNGALNGPGFREALQSDHKSQTFSYIAIDDDSKKARTVELAIGALEFCGVICVAEPDFELGNFTRDELRVALLELARRCKSTLQEGDALVDAIGNATSGKDLFLRANRLVLDGPRLGKTEEWGRVLMALALEDPEWASAVKSRVARSPLVDGFWAAVRSIRTPYLGQMEKEPVVVFGAGELADRLRRVARDNRGSPLVT